MTDKSDTPRTDAAERECNCVVNGAVVSVVVTAAFARTLERELASCRKELERSKAGNCLKCGIGPQRETCAYPEACEHPGLVAAIERNQALLRLVSHAEREGPVMPKGIRDMIENQQE